MIDSIVKWLVVGREDLLDVLLGENVGSGKLQAGFPDSDINKGKLALGVFDEKNSYTPDLPALLVIEDRYFSEIFSWLRVYSGEIFPISQYTRVVLRSDYEKFERNASKREWKKKMPDRWACVAVGETLAQSEGEVDLQNMALSRLSSSFTLPVARTTTHFGQVDCVNTCIDRLKAIDLDRRFGKKIVSVDQLLVIWRIVDSDFHIGNTVEEAILFVVNEAEINNGGYVSNCIPRINDFPELMSDSIEARVMAFNQLSLEIIENNLTIHAENLAPVLAAAVFLVGRGTSHVFLLKRFGKIAPTAFAWFGVMAALSGPRTWDAAWLRTVKGAERLIRPSFDWSEVSIADVSWPEFNWLLKAFEGLDQLILLPKMLPRTLAVEVVPGVLLHVRLGGGEQENRHTTEPSAREQALENAMSQFIYLAQKVRGIVDLPATSAERQQNLELDSERTPRSKLGRQRRTKKDLG